MNEIPILCFFMNVQSQINCILVVLFCLPQNLSLFTFRVEYIAIFAISQQQQQHRVLVCRRLSFHACTRGNL